MPQNLVIETLAAAFVPMFQTDKVLAALPTIAPQLADPYIQTAGVYADGVIDIGPSNSSPSNYGKFLFYGTGTAAQTFEAKLIGWQLASKKANGLWIPITIADLTCTLGSTTGPTGSPGPVLSTNKMVSGIAVISSLVEPNYDLWPADNGIQMIRFDLTGFQRLQLCIGPSGGATSANALFSGF